MSDYLPLSEAKASIGNPFSTIAAAIDELPTKVSLVSLCPPVYDQGDLGSCTGNAIAGAIEFDLMKEGLQPIIPSRLFIYYNERLLENTVNQDAGALIGDGIKVIANYGYCSETTWPYDISKFSTKPSDAAYNEAKVHLALDYYAVDHGLDNLKHALASGYPVVGMIYLFESFDDESVEETGIVPMPNPNEKCEGGHAILFVGYDDDAQHVIVRNSWGPDWGDHGYFYLPYAYMTHWSAQYWVVKTVQ